MFDFIGFKHRHIAVIAAQRRGAESAQPSIIAAPDGAAHGARG